MKKKVRIFSVVVFLFISILFVRDIVISYGEFDRNQDNLRMIENKQHDISRANHYMQLKIDRFSKDPKAAEEILRGKYRMIRSDQYKYIPEQ